MEVGNHCRIVGSRQKPHTSSKAQNAKWYLLWTPCHGDSAVRIGWVKNALIKLFKKFMNSLFSSRFKIQNSSVSEMGLIRNLWEWNLWLRPESTKRFLKLEKSDWKGKRILDTLVKNRKSIGLIRHYTLIRNKLFDIRLISPGVYVIYSKWQIILLGTRPPL